MKRSLGVSDFLDKISAQFLSYFLGFPGGSEGKASACNVGDLGLIPGSGRSPGEGNGNPLQYSCLENPMTEKPNRLQSTGSQKSDTTERLQFHFSLYAKKGPSSQSYGFSSSHVQM